MERKIEFIEISILCKDGSTEHYLSKIDFHNWLHSHLFSIVEAFPYLKYTINGEEKHLKIDKNLNIWKVVNHSEEDKIKIEFSFECNEGKKFITTLNNAYFDYLYPNDAEEAHITPDAVTPPSK